MTETKRIVITGSSGFLGQHLLNSLMTKGPSSKDVCYEIFALYESASGFASDVVAVSPHSQVTVTFDQLELTNQSDVKEWVSFNKPLDICLHLAAISSPAKCQDNADLAHAVNCPTAFFSALAEANVQVVALSTDQVYDGQAAPYVETDKPQPVNVYGKTKVALEHCLKDLFPNTSVALRSSILLGPGAPFGKAHSTFLHFCMSRGDISTEFYTDECRSVVAVSNVVSVLTYFAEKGVLPETEGCYNMGGADRVSRHDMAMAVACHFGLDEQYIVPKKKADQQTGQVQSPLDIAMDSSKLEGLVGFKFKGLEDIIVETFGEKS